MRGLIEEDSLLQESNAVVRVNISLMLIDYHWIVTSHLLEQFSLSTILFLNIFFGFVKISTSSITN